MSSGLQPKVAAHVQRWPLHPWHVLCCKTRVGNQAKGMNGTISGTYSRQREHPPYPSRAPA
eukprot:6468703-Pyramimonas_sp.AAC.1